MELFFMGVMGGMGLVATEEGMRHATAGKHGVQVLPGNTQGGGGFADATDSAAFLLACFSFGGGVHL
jgi:hypothetical protein